jgi:molybdopterin-guanine dinucleotide biosynthesis protein A
VVESVTLALGEPPLVVANAPEAAGWRADLRTVPDAHPGSGSLGGIHTALLTAGARVLCVAWDMPFLSPGLLRALVEDAKDFDAFLPESRCARCTGHGVSRRSSGSARAATSERSVFTPTCALALCP